MENLIFITAQKPVRVFFNPKFDCLQILREHESYGSLYDVSGFYDENLEPIGGKEILTKSQKIKLRPLVREYYES